MRVNVYAEELTDKVSVVEHTKQGPMGPIVFKGVRIMLELPVTGGYDGLDGIRGPYIGGNGDDCSAAITLWGNADGKMLRRVLRKALEELGDPGLVDRLKGYEFEAEDCGGRRVLKLTAEEAAEVLG